MKNHIESYTLITVDTSNMPREVCITLPRDADLLGLKLEKTYHTLDTENDGQWEVQLYALTDPEEELVRRVFHFGYWCGEVLGIERAEYVGHVIIENDMPLFVFVDPQEPL